MLAYASIDQMTENNVFLGIGSNLNKEQNIQSCIDYFQASFQFCKISPVYQSPSFGFKGNAFFNFVIHIKTHFDLLPLKTWLLKVEDLHGRDRSQVRYSNRTLDIDILLFNNDIYKSSEIIIPRPEILKRDYVLKPLTDVTENLTHPQTGKLFTEHWCDLMQNNRRIGLITKLSVVDLRTYQK